MIQSFGEQLYKKPTNFDKIATANDTMKRNAPAFLAQLVRATVL